MKIYKVAACCFLMTWALCAWSIDFSRINISWQYDPLAEIQMWHQVVQNDDSIKLFIKFKYDESEDWNVKYLIQDNYESLTHIDFKDFSVDSLITDRGLKVMQLNFRKPDENLLVIEIGNEDTFYYYDVPIKNALQPFTSIYPVNDQGLPIFQKFINMSAFKIEGADSIFVMQYRENFDLADPPMADMKPLAPSLTPDSIYWVQNEPKLSTDYFYVLRLDSNAQTGLTVLRTPPYYPEQKLLRELSFSMQYILNEPEKKELIRSTNLKETFNSFWLKTFTTQFRARNAIRDYFNSVELANRFFSDFKQGWKTDRGMIYVVYGAPDEVYRSNNEEEWFYDSGPGFEYTVISTFFSPKTYSLRRSKELEDSWYEFIAAIRRGVND